jgi:hypothetical protein
MEMVLKEKVCDGLNWILLAGGRQQRWALENMIMNSQFLYEAKYFFTS